MELIDKIEIEDRCFIHILRIVYKDNTKAILYPIELKHFINKLIESYNNHENHIDKDNQ